MRSFGKVMYNHMIGPITVAGQREEVVEETQDRLVTRAHKCVELDVWKQVTSVPELICEMDAVFMSAMAEAFNPDLVYRQYAGPLKEGKIQWGLPWGKNYCEFVMENKGHLKMSSTSSKASKK